MQNTSVPHAERELTAATVSVPLGVGVDSGQRPPAARQHSLWVPLMLFLLVLSVHSLSRVTQSCDSMWSVHLGLSMMREGNTDLDEYRDVVLSGPRYLYAVINGHVYSSYPIGTPLLAAPLVYVIDEEVRLLCRASPKAEVYIRSLYRDPVERVDAASLHRWVEVLVASLIVALTTVLVYCVGRQFLHPSLSLLLACVFAFCTPAWSTASRALWQHGPSMLMLSAALLILLQARQKPCLVQYASLPLAYSFVVRPTNALSIVGLSLFVAIRHRRYLLQYLAWSLVVVVPFVWYNLWLYHAMLPPYFSPEKVGATAHLIEGLAGNLVSPARGLFVFCPVLAFSVWGMVLSLRSREDHLLGLLLVGVVVSHWLVISSFPDWHAGHSFGPRYFTDVMPFLVYFLIPVVVWFSETRSALRSWLLSLFVLLAVVSLLVNLSGAMNKATYRWNSVPTDIDKSPRRLWDWTDLQFLRGIVKE